VERGGTASLRGLSKDDPLTEIPKLAVPIVMVHGIGAFDRLFARRRPAKEYFPGVRPMLEAAGNRVVMPRLPGTAGVEARSAALKSAIRWELGGQPFHLVGHSLGGLDSRFLVSNLGMAGQVVSLATMGTPHTGSSFADWLVDRFARYFQPLYRRFNVPCDAVFDLTTAHCRRFNEQTPDVPGVRYFSVAGEIERPMLPRGFRLTARIVEKHEGPNDGVVSVASARWGEGCDVWAGDHLNLVNWPNKRMAKAGEVVDRGADYGRLLGWMKGVEL
jgi:triacylglycerol lipase